MKPYYILLIIFSFQFHFAQIHKDEGDLNDENKSYSVKIEIDSSEIKYLEELNDTLTGAYVYALPKLKNRKDSLYFEYLKRKVYNIYPYYLAASKEYHQFQDSLVKFSNDKTFKKKMKARKKKIMEKYENDIRKIITPKEGRIFTKLMYRDTGKTTYDIYKEMHGGWNAYWMNAKAGLVNVNLHEKYFPLENREDYFIEIIIRLGIKSKILKENEYY